MFLPLNKQPAYDIVIENFTNGDSGPLFQGDIKYM